MIVGALIGIRLCIISHRLRAKNRLETSANVKTTEIIDSIRISDYESSVPPLNRVFQADSIEYEQPCNQLNTSSDENHVYADVAYNDK